MLSTTHDEALNTQQEKSKISKKESLLKIKSYANRDNIILAIVLTAIALTMFFFIISPLASMANKSLLDSNGNFVGLTNFAEYLSSDSLWYSLKNTLFIGITVTVTVSAMSFGYAYSLTRSCMPFKKVFNILGSAPILAPSLLPALSLVYLFGNQGVANSLLMGKSIYGPIGIIIGLVFWTFPHSLMIISTSLKTSDARLYEAAKALKTSPIKTFFIITLPGAKFGLVSSLIVVFTLTVCDFGVPQVIGGSYNVLATDIYNQVVGQQNFSMGAVASIILLFPAVLAFFGDRWVQRKQQGLFDSRSVAYIPAKSPLRDNLCFAFCAIICLAIAAVIGMAIYGSLVTYWPWNLTLSLKNYNFSAVSTNGWEPYFNSLRLSSLVAFFGTAIIFIGAYGIEKGRSFRLLRQLLQVLAIVPVAIPGLVLGLGYIFFFNDSSNPLTFLYGTMTILVINTIVHLYTVPHMTALTALKQLPAEIEAISSSIKLPQYKVFFSVTLPVCSPALMDIAVYLFVNAMTTTSAIVFLYSTDSMPASISVLNMSGTGQTGAAAAMCVMILLTSAIVKVLHLTLGQRINRRTQSWRKR